MFTREHIYTVHENETVTDPDARLVLVREGFSLWAFVFTLLWTLANRLWILSAIYLTLVVLVIKGGALLEIDETTQLVLQLGLQFWLGFIANDAKRDALTRTGYEEVAVVCAESESLGLRRYYDYKLA